MGVVGGNGGVRLVSDVGWAADVTLGGDEAWVVRRVGWGLRGVTGLWCLGDALLDRSL